LQKIAGRIKEQPDIPLRELIDEFSLPVSVPALCKTINQKLGLYRKKTAHAAEQQRPDAAERRTVAWVLGHRDTASFWRLYDKVSHLKHSIFYTNQWNAFAEVLPPEGHVIGRAHTHCIERDNSNTRHPLGRFTRRTKGGSQKAERVNLALKLWQALTDDSAIRRFQALVLNIFK
jgi:insertion element IS1 protein InsB